MPPRAKDTAADRLFGALANPTRREVLDLLLDGPQTVTDIAARFSMARPSVSEHLKVLRDSALVTEEKRGRHRYYAINPEPISDLVAWLHPYERFWRARMKALGSVLDEI